MYISKFGIKIQNYEAASIYEYQNGFRNKLDSKDAMLSNSLFLDFLMENGLNVWKEKSTRDVICIEFGYGTKDYETTMSKLNKLEDVNGNLAILKSNIEANKDKCVEISKVELRSMFYENGVDITYKTYNKKQELIKLETIHYEMLFRTPGKAKKGTCMFINKKLYKKAVNFLHIGIKLPEKNAPIVQMGAYSSLITSSICGKIHIDPSEILVMADAISYTKENVLLVETDECKHCTIRKENDYELMNTMFDGQALIDSSIFPEWGNGYILLRHHMTKCAAFNTNIELFMREKYGDSYETATIKDMWGNDVAVRNIKMITTESAMKWLTFNVSFEYWSEWVRKNGSIWGIVKTAHESKLGDVQRMSYQMVNSLNTDSMPEVVDTTIQYINKLKTDNEVFLDYLDKNKNFFNDFEVLIALVNQNPDFVYSSYFRDRKYKIIETYVLNFKSGRSIQNADNLTIVGSPYAMLMCAVGENPLDDPTFAVEDGCIQCWTSRFDNKEYLAEFRSPFNSRNNLGYLHNVYHPYFDKYFNLGKLCIAVNMVGTSFQDRNNGLTYWLSVQKCA